MGQKGVSRSTEKRLATQKADLIEPMPRSATVKVTQERAEFSGPIPPPDQLKSYDDINPGFANRIMVMAERQAEHRQGLERQAIEAQIKDAVAERSERNRGQWMAFIVTFAFIGVGAFLIHSGHEWPGTILGASGLTGIVLAFLTSSRIKAAEAEPTKSLAQSK